MEYYYNITKMDTSQLSKNVKEAVSQMQQPLLVLS